MGPYAIGGELGQGSSAVVFAGVHAPTRRHVALKVIEKADVWQYASARRLHNELSLMARIDSPHVARLLETIHTPERLYLVLEHGGVRGVCAEIKLLSTPWRN